MKNFFSLKISLVSIVSLFTLSYVALISLIYFYQESLLFLPEKLTSDYQFNLKDVHEVRIEVTGATLSALYYRRPNPDGLVFFLHGNAGSLKNWLTDTSFYEKVNYDLFMLDYRGYGKSTGSIESEEQFYDDIHRAWKYAINSREYKSTIIYGRSLGTAPAAYLSGIESCDLTVLVSPYYNMSKMAELYYPWVPKALLRYPFDTAKHLKSIKNPVLIFHGTNDKLIPPEHSKLLEEENHNVKLILVENAQHDDMHLFDTYIDHLNKILTELAG
ncbi:MAG TPA: alpha/beta fold hydrolase [Oligoflexia bacterium]|nr:alpha/beta fold hydrolase [Oligoflexia bacterium]HMP47665.1 alpha/beta fold hydrolase [Oligoflexia bacterium]